MNVVDTHVHVFVRGLKLAAVRRYVPDYDATIDDYLQRMDRFGITHAVMVQPSFLGTDNSFMCGVLREHRDRLRGIAVVEPEVSAEELDALQNDGVVGIRLNLDSLPIPEFDKGPWPALLGSLVKRDWQVEVHRESRDQHRVVDPLVEAGVRVVVDHFGRLDDDLGAADPGFQYLLGKAASGRVWVKLSGAYRNGSEGRGFAHAPEAARQLLASFGAERLVWGSDWPHTRHESYIDIPRMRREVDLWVPDPEQRALVLGQTALELFKF